MTRGCEDDGVYEIKTRRCFILLFFCYSFDYIST